MSGAGFSGLPAAQPVTFGGCLGWLHLPAGRPLGRGVVVCPPWGHEALTAYRGLRDLAERCAAAGLPALRFDYPGTGDSAGADASGRFEAFRVAIADAAAWLARATGVAEVALCGLRMGALLAAEAAPRCRVPVAALALVEPIASGRAWRRELMLRAATGANGAPDPEWIEVAGERLHHDDLARFESHAIEPALAASGIGRVLVLSRRRLAGLPPGTELMPFAGVEEFLTHQHLSRIPQADFARLASWLAIDAPAGPAPGIEPPEEVELDIAGGTETALRFGPAQSLAGVLCRPVGREARVAVLLLSTGMTPRSGVGRLGTHMARRLARIGVASLRMDLAGIGDSAPVPGQDDPAAPPDIYREAVVAEARAGVDLLTAGGAATVLVVGICAGAHAALQLARLDPRVGGLSLFNLPAFDRAAGGAPALDGGPPPGEPAWLRRPRMLLRRLKAEADRAIAGLTGLESGLDRPNAWMRDLDARGVRVLLGYSARDRGLRELRAHFGRGGRRLAGTRTVRRIVLDGTDHSLAPRAMQEQAIRLVTVEALTLDLLTASRRRAALEARRRAQDLPLPTLSQASEAARLHATRVRP